MRLGVLALVPALFLAGCATTFPGDGGEPSYADKPASWWIEQYLSPKDSDAARAVLREMGDAAAPELAAALTTARNGEERLKLLDLLDELKGLPAPVVDLVRPSLRSEGPAEQAAALRVVQRSGASAAALAEDVARGLDSRHQNVRTEAARALGALGDAAVPFVPALAAKLGDDEREPEFVHVVALGQIGPRAAPALPTLLAFAAGRPPHGTIVRALVSIGPDDARVADQVVRAVEIGEERVRESTLEHLGHADPAGEAILDAAVRLAANADRAVRIAAAQALGHGRAGRAVPGALFALLADDDIGVVGAAARSIEERGSADHSMAGRVGEIWQRSRRRAAISQLLMALRPECGPALLEGALADDAELRAEAWRLLIRAGPQGVLADADQVARLVLDARVDIEQRTRLLSLVVDQGLLPEETARSVCVTVLAEAEPGLAIVAAPRLAGDATRRNALLAALGRPEPVVRVAALDALRPLVPRFEDVRTACVLALDDADPAVRDRALQVLQCDARQVWAEDTPSRIALAERLPALAGVGVEQRRAVVAILYGFPDAARPLDALVALLPHDDSAETTMDLFRRTPADAAEALRPLLAGDDAVLVLRAGRVAWRRHPADAEVVLTVASWIESDDPRTAREAVLAACDLPPGAIASFGGALIRVARSGVREVAWPALHALARIAPKEPAARDALLAIADDAQSPVQTAVIQFLPELGEDGMKRVVAFLEHPQRDARRTACVVLISARHNGRSGWADAVPALEGLATGDDLEIARLARQALDTPPR